MSTLKLKLLVSIFLTTTPFLLLFSRLNWSFVITQPTLFSAQLIATTASVTGLIGALLMFWQIVLGVRFIAVRLSKDVMNLNKVHKWLGIFSFLLIMLHPILNVVSYKQSLGFMLIPNFSTEFNTHVSYGVVAFLLLLCVFISSALLKSKIPYRWWHYFHLSTYLIIGLVLVHARAIGTVLNTIPVASFFWTSLMILFPLIILMRISQWLGFLKKRYLVVSVSPLAKGIFKLTLAPIAGSVSPKVGQYVYLQRRRGGEAHPFTVMEHDADSGQLKFGIKESGPYSSLLAKIKKNSQVFVDGPYGVFTAEGQNNQPKVLLAGGIGITPFVQLITKFRNSETYLFYSNSFFANTIFHSLFKKLLGKNYFASITRENTKDQNVIHERLNAKVLKAKLPTNIFNTANFFICGPEPFYNSLKTSLLQAGVPTERVYYEMFEL